MSDTIKKLAAAVHELAREWDEVRIARDEQLAAIEAEHFDALMRLREACQREDVRLSVALGIA
jgi:c-di-AMP phosphodiesterase-like protein